MQERIGQLLRNSLVKASLDGDACELILHSGEVDTSGLEQTKIYYQVVHLQALKPTCLDVNEFAYTVSVKQPPSSPKSSGMSVASRTVLRTAEYLPSAVSLSQVVSTEQHAVSEVEQLVCDIASRAKEIERCLDEKDVKMLSMYLCGALTPQVHQGMIPVLTKHLSSPDTTECERISLLSVARRLAFGCKRSIDALSEGKFIAGELLKEVLDKFTELDDFLTRQPC